MVTARRLPSHIMSNLGVYIQVPFCAAKCTFCNFSSSVERSSIFDVYTQALQNELDGWPQDLALIGVQPEFLARKVDSVYFGGGTPTLLGVDRLSSIIRALHGALRWSDDVEFTLETTPGSADAQFLHSLLSIGINRLSIGAQTFDQQELRATGRLHTVEETVASVREAREAGFKNISLDLIAGLPHQTTASFQHSLEEVARLRPEHVSLYLFEVDEKSRLGREVVQGGNRYHAETVPGDDFMADAYETGCAFLAREGYQQYEISNFALPGFESRHNRKYWQLGPYLGLGAGAHSFDGNRRWSNQIDARKYIEQIESGASPLGEWHTLTVEEQLEEFFFLGLRQVEGVNLGVARARWGASCLAPWAERIGNLESAGWLICHDDQVCLSRRACLVSNEIFQEFVSAASHS
jgi:oxygen-independent coproporphyrinogen III oxidase